MMLGQISALLCLAIIPLVTSVPKNGQIGSGPQYVLVGDDITGCHVTCPDILGILQLFRRCGGQEEELLMEYICHTNFLIYHMKTRLRLDTKRGCWTLPQAGRGDSCVYELRDWGHQNKPLTSTSIHVLGPVLIYNISSNCSRLGEDIAVTVQFSGEESAVTWEVAGGRVPDRCRLIDDNRTLIIPSVQRDEAERTFRVRVTNPVSEEVRDHRLKIPDVDGISVGVIAAFGGAAMLVTLIICFICRKSAEERNRRKWHCGNIYVLLFRKRNLACQDS